MDTNPHKVSLVDMRSLNNKIENGSQRMQHCCSHRRTKEMLDGIENDI